MTTSVYPIHQAVDRPIHFKGFQGQYILLAGGTVIGDLLLFILLYCCKLNPWLCILIAFTIGAAVLLRLAWASKTYGQYGLLKKRARRHIPKCLPCRSRIPFLQLNTSLCYKRIIA